MRHFRHRFPASSDVRRSVFSLCAVVAMLALLIGAPAAVRAEEVTVMNDSVSEASPTTVGVAGFVEGEQAAVWLDIPCDGTLVALQVAWVSNDINALPVVQRGLHVYQEGTFPNPGSGILQIEGPQLEVNVFNEFRYLDEDQNFPINLPVTTGQTIVVALEYDIDDLDPALARDVDGCQAGRNGIYAEIAPNTYAWFNACSLGVNGDFVIRAVVDCQDVTQEFGFRTATSDAGEDSGIATIEVEISGGGATSGPGTVDYAVTGGTATGSGTDYTLVGNGTLAFAQDDTIKTIAVLVTDDGDAEGDETVEITLSNPTGGYAVGSNATHTLTILDNEVIETGSTGVKVR